MRTARHTQTHRGDRGGFRGRCSPVGGGGTTGLSGNEEPAVLGSDHHMEGMGRAETPGAAWPGLHSPGTAPSPSHRRLSTPSSEEIGSWLSIS